MELLRRIIVSILLAVCAVAASAQQTVSVSGRLFDNENNEGVIGAVIEVVPVAAPDKVRYYTSEYGGYFKIPALREGRTSVPLRSSATRIANFRSMSRRCR